MTVYRVQRYPGEVVVMKAPGLASQVWYRLRPPRVHSPTGFEFGYGGSGPADLALAILLDHFGEGPHERGFAMRYHQALKRAWVEQLEGPGPHYLETEQLETLLLTFGASPADARRAGG